MKSWLAIALCLLCILAEAQVQVHIKLLNGGDSCYLAGNINGWNPADANFRFSRSGDLTIAVATNQQIEYKITKGSWTSVECQSNGIDIGNRRLKAGSDTSINVIVEGWKDLLSKQPLIKHTASPNVSVLDSAFVIKSLSRTRTIRIYLPKDYSVSAKRYPVLYMHDGQNLFDVATSFAGEWEVDETLDKVYDSTRQSMIVVAIDNGGEFRLTEYNPFDHFKYGKAEGVQYVSFIVNQLKPFIDRSFRTLKEKGYTAIAGSSMGGLISMYAILTHPDVFGSAGIFSPSFAIAPGIFQLADEKGALLNNAHIFLYAGGKESEHMVPDLDRMREVLKVNEHVTIRSIVDQAA